MAEIRRAEHRHPQLWPGIISEVLPTWEKYARNTKYSLWNDNLDSQPWTCCWECCGSPLMAKDFLDILVHAMRGSSAREIRARLRHLDDLHGLPFP
ncbi:hypothetical protein HNR06_004439 [Nocardiopsis arvandica]|uniref:Uncharacterized protein n=1 Tax=Nocardiopsis sinuspersici TaxID=501010 RepID=A0A7Y9XHT2_9ACTN|nr:hypothetical protein [Nocardiopsis sinuspersici]